MNEGTKKRLAGTLVLVCLAIIFVPILLDGEGLRSPELEIDVPPAPELPEVSDIQPQRPDFVLEREAEQSADPEAATTNDPDATAANSIEPLPVSEPDESDLAATDDPAPATEIEAETETNELEQPTLNEQGLPDAWSVRLGAFGEQANAEALVERLQAGDYKAYMRRYSNSNGTLTAVYVGPVLTREQADELRDELQSGFELEGMVERFSVE